MAAAGENPLRDDPRSGRRLRKGRHVETEQPTTVHTGETGDPHLGVPATSGTDVIAVVGACTPERREYARRLAASRHMTLVPAGQLAGPADPDETLRSALALNTRVPGSTGLVLEYPVETSARSIVADHTHEGSPTRLRELICIVDAAHLLADLTTTAHVPLGRSDAEGTPLTAPRAELIVTQIEFASTVVLTNCSLLRREEQDALRSLTSHLSPEAHVELASVTRRADYPNPGAGYATAPYTREQTRPGWIALLNDEFAPQHRHSRVSALRYEQMRPFHPRRLARALQSHEALGRGRLLRSVGFCRLCSRPHITAQWGQVGGSFSLTPAALDSRLTAADEPLALGQDLALIGLDLDLRQLAEALDAAALTDAELLAGPEAWRTYPDPFPAWRGADQR
jgi:G3E family GTPase